MLEKADRIAVQGCSSSCNILPRYQLSRRMAKKRLEVKHLIDTCNFDTVVTQKKSPVRAVEKQQGPSLAGQREAVEMIERLLKFLKGGENKRIAVWGMGGVGIKGLGFGKEKVPPDDVWERIDLDIGGVPQDDDQANCKIFLTTRSLDVCRAMMTNEENKLDVLNKAASWNLFAQNAGDVVEVPGINPLARAVARECSGLPLALETVEMSTRNRRKIELWKHALHHLQRSAPHVKCIEDEVYLPLMLRYNSLPTDRLINGHQTLEECFNDGIALVENLKDSWLLEQGEWAGTVRLHDMVRDVAIWISKKRRFSCESSTTSHVTKQGSEESCRRKSFMNITKLPKQLSGFSEITVLFLLGFHSLESLDLSFSAYKWDARCNIEDERAAFDEILTLEKLSIVKIRLDKVDSLVLDASWLRRLREFNIQIRPTSRYSNYLPTEHNEKRVILRGVDLMGRGLKGLLCSATALDLVICGGMSALSELDINNSLSGLKSLKSLTISKCDCITSLISGENIVGSILPKLEHVSLSRLENLAANLGGMVPRRGCLKMVKNYRGGGLRSVHRNDLKAKSHKTERFDHVNDYLFKGTCLPSLEKIEVRNCPMLTKLPFATSNAVTLRGIKGDLQWWNNLVWDDVQIRFSLQQRFQPFTASPMLKLEDRWVRKIPHSTYLDSYFRPSSSEKVVEKWCSTKIFGTQ
ncbi:Uncharacterized protein TCM_031115 [Theobroma cacao]|uniref:NB-ARC domain-containing protein n=1 Tax=Theobroma cacao TaxID=3641 RepID=A0A061FDP9_THECC|nr:Uncharacterized protein TCM_031115 [Theobroma cacao]